MIKKCAFTLTLLAGLAILWSCSSPVGDDDGEQAATPVIDIDAGTYYGAQLVTISCATAGATIRYTTDGSEPTASSAVYSDFVPVTRSMTLKAKAISSGKTDSEIASRALTIHYASYGDVDGAPCYWIDETRHMLPLPSGATWGGVHSIRVTDGETFIVGIVSTPDDSLPYCWTNDVGSTFPTVSGAQFFNMAYSLSTSGSDWYIPGDYDSLDDSSNRPCYWKNGNLVTLAIPSGYDNGATAEDVNFSGGDILVTGRVWRWEEVGVACYWRNGSCTILTGGAPSDLNCFAQDILVSGDDVYVTGFVSTPNDGGSYERPCLWKNGQFQYLGGQALASGGYRAGWMYMDGSDLYLGGYIYDIINGNWVMTPMYWKNGILVEPSFPDSSSGGVWWFEKRGTKVIPCGDRTTAAGHEDCYWVDGTYHGTAFMNRSVD